MWFKRSLFLLVLLLAACQPATPTPAPMPVLWQVNYTPTLRWMGPLFNTCIQQHPGNGLLVFERPAVSLNPEEADFGLRWGAPANLTVSAAVIGWDELVFITHPDNPVKTLSRDDLKAIFSGAVRTWDAFDAGSANIELWFAQDGSDVQQVFQSVLGADEGRRPYSFIAPDQLSMRQAVAASPVAIGYLPRRWLDASVQAVEVSTIDPEALRQPILALYSREPQAEKKEWLLCVQKSIAEQP
jgi:hypothetical protein